MRISDRPRYPWEPEGLIVRMETPEQIEVEYRVAPFSIRLAGAFLDQLLIYSVLFVLLVVILIVGVSSDAAMEYMVGVAITISFLLQTFYFVVLELRTGGQTPGKRAVKCRAVSITGQPLTVGAALLRNLARVVDNIPLVWFVPALNPARRRIGDFLAGTLVVMADGGRTKELQLLGGKSYRELDDRRFVLDGEVASRLVPEDIDLLEYFFKNKYRLHMRAREVRTIPLQIALKYVKRLGLHDQAPAVQEDPVRFLQELYLFLQERFNRSVF